MIALDIETTGLDPLTDRITCIGFCTPAGITQFSSQRVSDDSERSIIIQSFDYLLRLRNPPSLKLVSFNGINFDIPFIASRASKLFTTEELIYPYCFHHLDLSIFVKNIFKRYISKDEAIRKLSNIYVPRSSSGLHLARLYNQPTIPFADHMDMLHHNAQDLIVTAKFYDFLLNYKDFNDFISSNTAIADFSTPQEVISKR